MEADHFALEVSSMDKAIEFYAGILQLKLVSRDVCEDEGTEYAFLELGKVNLELVRLLTRDDVPSPNVRREEPYCPHLALRTDDMDQTLLMLKEKQIPILEGPYEIAGVVKWVYFTDPDNNVLEFVQWL